MCVERFYNMIYLPEDCIVHIMSFFDEDSVEKLFMSLTSKYFNFVVKKYLNVKKQSSLEHLNVIEKYYYASMNNMNMIYELESLNMRSIPVNNVIFFLVKMSENVDLLKYFYENPLYGVDENVKIKIKFNKNIIDFLFLEVRGYELKEFLIELDELEIFNEVQTNFYGRIINNLILKFKKTDIIDIRYSLWISQTI